MQLFHSQLPRRRRSRGLSLFELLLCVSIGAMMLLATGIAFRASVMAYRDNTDRNMLISQGRTAMRQIISEIRQGDGHAPYTSSVSAQFSAGQTVDDLGITITKTQPDVDDPSIVPGTQSTWVVISWSYDAAKQQILRKRALWGQTGVSSVIAQYVQSFNVHMEPLSAGSNVLQRAVVTIALRDVDASGKIALNQGSGLVTERLIDSAVPRKFFTGY
jgi:Tfp pilus assembly protein PilW